MKPYYQDDWVTIYHGDCREILPELPKVDLVLTDPPYGLSWSGTGFKKQPLLNHLDAAKWDKKPNADLIKKVMSAGFYKTIWGFNYLADLIGPSNGCLVWDKMTGKNPFADGELAFSDTVGTMRIYHHQWCGAFKDSERGIKNEHPTQKPIQLMAWCISLAPKAEIIIDPFMGSGTTLRAAKDLKRHAIGIEIEEKYCEIAARRMSQEVMI